MIENVYSILFYFIFLIAEYKVHTYNRNGLCALGFMDDHYPIRSAFSLLNQVRIRAPCLGSVLCCIYGLLLLPLLGWDMITVLRML